MNIGRIHIDRDGVEFTWRGDSIIYVFPHRRAYRLGGKWLSISFGTHFRTLDALAAEWRGYVAANGVSPRCALLHEPPLNRWERWLDRGLP